MQHDPNRHTPIHPFILRHTAMVAATLPPPPAPVTVAAAPAAPAMDESALRKEIQGEVARQLRAFGPAGPCVTYVVPCRDLCYGTD